MITDQYCLGFGNKIAAGYFERSTIMLEFAGNMVGACGHFYYIEKGLWLVTKDIHENREKI